MPEQLTHKVGFSGAGGVGKTELIKAVKLEIGATAAGFIDESARVYFRDRPYIPIERRYDFEPQSEIQTMVMELERIAQWSQLDLLFTDRTVFDAPVCVASTGDMAGTEHLFDRAKIWIPHSSEIAYSRIYVLDPADVPFENDSERLEDEVTRQLQHESFLDFFTGHRIPFKLLSGTLDERTQKVLAALPTTCNTFRKTKVR